MKQISVLALLAVLSSSLSATPPETQGTAGASTSKSTTRKATTTRRRTAATTSSTAATSVITTELQQMKAALDAQQRQIEQLRQDLASRDQQIREAQQQAQQAQQLARDAQGRTETVATTASTNNQTISALKSDVADIKLNATNNAVTMQEAQKAINESPAAIRFKGTTISFTGSFLAAETIWRDRGMGADVNTQLTGAPFNGAPNANLSEFNASGRQSRLAILAEGKVGSWTGRGYWETDWLSAGTTSNSNQSNSYTNRQRQIFAQAESDRGWTFTGGQMWSLVTETRTGLQNRTEALPQTIDSQYTAGFSWERQYGFRVTKAFGKTFFLGGAVEEAQTLNLGGGGAGTFIYQQAGNTAGLLNNGGNTAQQNYSYNYLPDFVFKAAFEPKYGHYEVFGLLRGFRNRVFPNATAANVGTAASGVGAFNFTTLGGGAGFNARLPIVPKKLDFGFHILAGDGVGRYGDSTLADVTARADGTLAPIRGGSALAGLELHATPKLDVYAYYGGDYAERQLYNGAGSIGYGRFSAASTGCNVATIAATGNNTPASSTTNPANCSPDIRAIQELSTGYWYDFYRGQKGRLRLGFQYSYLQKQTWRGTGGSPNANTNMVFTSFRYYLP
ncbi:MAG TPA: hypothetical protein VF493_17085 [Terriglobales bacterium]